MRIKELADTAADEVADIIGHERSGKGIAAAIEKAIIAAVLEEHQKCTSLATQCCDEDRDLAHKISSEIEQASKALIANLSSMR